MGKQAPPAMLVWILSNILGWQMSLSARSPGYKAWRREFMNRRLELELRVAVVAYLTFILLRGYYALRHSPQWDPSWLVMALIAETGLVIHLLVQRSPWGQQYPQWIFLGASWTVTLVEQIWASTQGVAFPGLYSWTLVFLTQATLVPVRWRYHLLSQLGVLAYYYGVNNLLGFVPVDQPLWDTRQALYLFWFCGICDLSVYLYEKLQAAEFWARRALEAEQARSERLLLNILPEPVAKKLKRQEGAIADSFAEATVLFADIVGFTQIASAIPPDRVVAILNTIFSRFDQLADLHGLEKIKTIGDAYMVVGGIPVERPDHTEAIADMALDMQQAIADFSDEQNQLFQIRIGINTGPVVAGVIGRKKFIYDLWGDAVNIASRMESQGVPDRIQVTPAVYERLRDRYHFEERGRIDIKGRGTMTTYFLLGKKLPG
ncbi:MAG: adenylate/guanylate cyclase domain-containing protein [Synechococcales bacterium]|nr:adenylate/guanylate cyclase domain-containing protein [Synechococcales bacterium]